MSNLPTTMSSLKNSIMKAQQRLSATTGNAGSDFLRLTKAMTWEYGADDAEVESGSKWALNPQSFQMGFIAWGDSEVKGEAMAQIDADPIIKSLLKAAKTSLIAFLLNCYRGLIAAKKHLSR